MRPMRARHRSDLTEKQVLLQRISPADSASPVAYVDHHRGGRDSEQSGSELAVSIAQKCDRMTEAAEIIFSFRR